jgi:hypothetical protein
MVVTFVQVEYVKLFTYKYYYQGMASAFENPSGDPILPAPTKEHYIETFSEFFETLKNDFKEMKENQSYLNVFDRKNICGYPNKNQIIHSHAPVFGLSEHKVLYWI